MYIYVTSLQSTRINQFTQSKNQAGLKLVTTIFPELN